MLARRAGAPERRDCKDLATELFAGGREPDGAAYFRPDQSARRWLIFLSCSAARRAPERALALTGFAASPSTGLRGASGSGMLRVIACPDPMRTAPVTPPTG